MNRVVIKGVSKDTGTTVKEEESGSLDTLSNVDDALEQKENSMSHVDTARDDTQARVKKETGTRQQSKLDRIELVCSSVKSRMHKVVVNTLVQCGERGRTTADTVAKLAMETPATGTHA